MASNIRTKIPIEDYLGQYYMGIGVVIASLARDDFKNYLIAKGLTKEEIEAALNALKPLVNAAYVKG